MYRTVWGTLQRTFWEAKAICAKNPRRQTWHFAPRRLLWLKIPKLTLLGKNAKKSWRNWETNVKKWWGSPGQDLSETKGICPEDQKDRETCATFVKRRCNLRESLVEPSTEHFGSPKQALWQPRGICPREPETTKLGGNLGRTLVEPSAQPFGSPRQIQRTRESLKAILPRNLYYGWRPQSYCCWGKTRPTLDLKKKGSTTTAQTRA